MISSKQRLRQYFFNIGIIFSILLISISVLSIPVQGYPDQTCEMFVPKGHAGHIWSSAFSTDGKYLLTGGADRTLRLWDLASGQELRKYAGQKGTISKIAISPDGKLAASEAHDWTRSTWAEDFTTVVVWNIASGNQIVSFKGKYQFSNPSFSNDGKNLLIWKTPCKEHPDAHTPPTTIDILDSSNWKVLRSFVFPFQNGAILAVSPDWSSVLCVDGRSKGAKVHLLAFQSRQELWSLPCDGDIFAQFTADGRFIFMRPGLMNDYLKDETVINAKTGQVIRSQPIARSPDQSNCLLSSDGKLMVISRLDFKREEEITSLLDIATGQEIWKTTQKNVYAGKPLAFSSSDKYIAKTVQSNDHTAYDLTFLDSQTGKEVWRAPHATDSSGHGVQLSPDDRFILTINNPPESNSIMNLLDSATGKEIHNFSTYPSRGSAAFSPDGKFILCGGQDKTLKVWDVTSARVVKILKGHSDAIVSVTYSDDGKYAFSASSDNTIKMWDTSACVTGNLKLS